MIEAKHVSFSAGDKPILDKVSVQISKGQVSVILGPNGAGKSTLLKCLSGSCKPDSGVITLDGVALQYYGLRALACKRAVLSQSLPVGFPFTVLEIVCMGRNPYTQSCTVWQNKKIAQAALDCVDACHLQNRIFPSLSGGEQQRVHLARVLSQLWEQKDACLFLDEPTSALDLKYQHWVLQLVRDRARQKNFAVCIVLHDLNLAVRYADSSILMKTGKVVATGATNIVLSEKYIEQVFEVAAKLVL